jgi:hypothetical protein
MSGSRLTRSFSERNRGDLLASALTKNSLMSLATNLSNNRTPSFLVAGVIRAGLHLAKVCGVEYLKCFEVQRKIRSLDQSNISKHLSVQISIS